MKKFLLSLFIITVSFYLLILLSSGIVTGCNTTEPPPPKNNGTLNLSLTDVSCTEAWVELKAQSISFPAQINFLLDGKALKNISLTSSDTTVYIDSLQPNKTYTLQASAGIGNQVSGIQSNKLSVATLDTTSNNFTWQTFTFGDPTAGSSHLSDVAIINENNIWAVGEIYMNDSTGKPDPNAYNTVHWDGSKWKLMRIEFYTVCGQTSRTSYPAKAIFAFNENEIWVAMDGDQIAKIENGIQTKTMCLPWSFVINKIWGSSSNDFYIVGNSGSIAHYHSGQWSKIQSGTTTNLNDVWGTNNAAAGSPLILATVSSRYQRGDYKLLSIADNTAQDFINWPYTRLYGLWFNSVRKIYIAGDGAYLYVNNKLSKIDLPTNYFLTRVKSNGLNDIYISGCCGTLIHFNGMQWHQIEGIYGNYEGMDAKGNVITVVGFTGDKAIITILRRQ